MQELELHLIGYRKRATVLTMSGYYDDDETSNTQDFEGEEDKSTTTATPSLPTLGTAKIHHSCRLPRRRCTPLLPRRCCRSVRLRRELVPATMEFEGYNAPADENIYAPADEEVDASVDEECNAPPDEEAPAEHYEDTSLTVVNVMNIAVEGGEEFDDDHDAYELGQLQQQQQTAYERPRGSGMRTIWNGARTRYESECGPSRRARGRSRLPRRSWLPLSSLRRTRRRRPGAAHKPRLAKAACLRVRLANPKVHGQGNVTPPPRK
ncbi:hypothetical protein B0H17DRAFT_212227 [Mycena rosella]|uniref:Uncharacterized protein n=1 Tax=Mycena rosella TaxID=1033263 RepID=A0AAD7DVM4_MYCRO|nr:hypothetical protein B0H17DRAFT_212227 [Mycena rosella]